MAKEPGKEDFGFETRAVHGGEEGGDPWRALTPPIYMTSTYTFPSMETVDRVTGGKEEGFVYSRAGNPTVREFERTMATLEGGEEGVAFSSGMGAISAVLLSWAKKGTPFLFSRHLYSGTRHFIESMLIPLGATVRFVSFPEGSPASGDLEEALREGAAGLFLETPSNPILEIVDLSATAALCRSYGVPLAVDNTFPSPALQNPLLLGADLVIHSATKYLGGHGDLLGGVAVGDRQTIQSLRSVEAPLLGATLSPMNAWLILRGIKTLALRMEAHSQRASHLARVLSGHRSVVRVHYPGLPEHPGHGIALRQMKGTGGMLAIQFASYEAARRFMDRLRIIRIGVSLGDPASLVEHPASMSHRGWSREVRQSMGIEEGLVRMSVGLESPDDLVRDVEGALAGL